MKTYIDTLAALVPAETLVLYAGIVIPNVTTSISVAGKKATVISDPVLMVWSCAGLLVLSAALYFVGRFQKGAKFTGWDVPKFLIPPASFAAWMLLENPSVWDVWWHRSSTSDRVVITAFAAIVLGILASALGYQVDQAEQAQQAAPANDSSGGGNNDDGGNDGKPGTQSVPGDNKLNGNGTGAGGPDLARVNAGTVTAPDQTASGDGQPTVTSPPDNAGDAPPVKADPPKPVSVASAPGPTADLEGDDGSLGSL